MKTIIPLVFVMSYAAPALAQGVFQNQTNGTLEKVIQDFPNQFKNIKGALLGSSAAIAEYKSIVTIPGAESSTVTQYSANNKKMLSWQTTVFTSASFDQASNKFKEMFGQIENTIVKVEGEHPAILNGQYETPYEDKTSTTVLFRLLPGSTVTREIKVDLSLEKIKQEWKIVLSVHDKDQKTTEPVAVN
jgi:hypothetical protein